MKHLYLIVLLFSISSIAQQKDPHTILDSCARAMGGQRQDLQVVARGEVHNPNPDSSIPVLIKTRGLEDFRIERGNPGASDLSVISKGAGRHHDGDHNSLLKRHNTAYFKPDHLPALVCSQEAIHGMRVTYDGEDKVNSRLVFHLKIDAVPGGKNADLDALESLISEY